VAPISLVDKLPLDILTERSIVSLRPMGRKKKQGKKGSPHSEFQDLQLISGDVINANKPKRNNRRKQKIDSLMDDVNFQLENLGFEVFLPNSKKPSKKPKKDAQPKGNTNKQHKHHPPQGKGKNKLGYHDRNDHKGILT
jgi:hypothetical protein